MQTLIGCALVGLVVPLTGRGASVPEIEVHDQGVRRVFQMAPNEVCTASGFQKIAGSGASQGFSLAETARHARVLQARAGGEVHLVFYEKGKPRNEWTRRVLTRRIMVQLAPDADPAALARAVNATSGRELSYAPRHFIFQTADSSAALSVVEQLRALPDVVKAELLLGKKYRRKSLPDDPLREQQWHLMNTSQLGEHSWVDINVTNVWERFRGHGIRIGIVDDGVQYTHPDLAPNYDTSIDYDYADDDDDPYPVQTTDAHGTAVAGLAAAAGRNGIGVTGVAYEATLVGIRLLNSRFQTDDQNAAALAHHHQLIHISNNSWGGEDTGENLEGPGPLMAQALEHGAREGRNGLGTIFVWSAGNGGDIQDNANYDGYANSIYTIAAGATTDQGVRPSYSEPGACLIICAPSDASENGAGTTTTDLIGDHGLNSIESLDDLPDLDYTQRFSGTSAAAPIVSGVVALMLEANPNLGWRDVQEILMRSARQNDATDDDWITNGAGFHFNHQYGAGLVNAAAAVGLATNWVNLPAATNIFIERAALSLEIPDSPDSGITQSFEFSPAVNLRVEHVTVTVDIKHERRGDLAITLISPQGTRSRLAEKHLDINPDYPDWKFMSVFNWGEESKGEWKVEVEDLRGNRTGTLESIRIDLFGTLLQVEQRPFLTGIRITDQTLKMFLYGETGASYEIQRSSDLKNWTTLMTLESATAFPIEIVDPDHADHDHRFYRAVKVEG